MPTYVQYGAADFGVAGKDVLFEHGGAGLYQPIDLGIAKCRMSVAVSVGFDYATAVRQVLVCGLRPAHRNGASTLRQQGVHIDLIVVWLHGSWHLWSVCR